MKMCYWYEKIQYFDDPSNGCYDSRHTCEGGIDCLNCKDKETCDKRGSECKWNPPNCDPGKKPSHTWKFIVAITGGTVGGAVFIIVVCACICYAVRQPDPNPPAPEDPEHRKWRKKNEEEEDRKRKKDNEEREKKIKEYLDDPNSYGFPF